MKQTKVERRRDPSEPFSCIHQRDLFFCPYLKQYHLSPPGDSDSDSLGAHRIFCASFVCAFFFAFFDASGHIEGWF